jgi:hypothetical protein
MPSPRASVLEDLARAGVQGRLVIEMSTLLPDQAEALAAQAAAAGADFLHCPVGGTVAPALKGQLLGLAGGTAAAFDRAKPVLDQLCRRVEHLGSPGAAARMKLAVNLPLAVYWQTLGESLALLRGAGGAGRPGDQPDRRQFRRAGRAEDPRAGGGGHAGGQRTSPAPSTSPGWPRTWAWPCAWPRPRAPRCRWRSRLPRAMARRSRRGLAALTGPAWPGGRPADDRAGGPGDPVAADRRPGAGGRADRLPGRAVRHRRRGDLGPRCSTRCSKAWAMCPRWRCRWRSAPRWR